MQIVTMNWENRTDAPALSRGQELAEEAVCNNARSHAFMFLLREIKHVKANGFNAVIRNNFDLQLAERAATILERQEVEE